MIQDETLIDFDDDGGSVEIVAAGGVIGEALAHPLVGQQSFDVGENEAWEMGEIDPEIDADETRPAGGGVDDDPSWGVPSWDGES